jgi:dimeric dUTPase (all-alpha-NTP-PPase superfamily)
MNLAKLFEAQKKLDEHIESKHPRESRKEWFEKKIIALFVEVGELANELPEVFKFWSNKKNNYEKALNEYVDGLHFILSIGLEYGIENISFDYIGIYAKPENGFLSIYRQLALLSTISSGKEELRKTHYSILVEMFISLGKTLGFTWEQIEKAYFEKNKINHERQVQGY